MNKEKENKNEQQLPYRRVMLATPTMDGKVDVEYVISLMESIGRLSEYNISLFPIFLAYDALIQRARNDIIELAINNDVDDIVFIDSDIGWTSDQLIRLLSHNVDFVGGTYRRKSDEETYVMKIKDDNVTPNEDGLVEVNGIGCGFMRMTRKCYRLLWESSERYEDNNGKRNKRVFDIKIINGIYTSEDISLCYKWQELGGKVWLDPTITCSHTGMKKYTGNFLNWIKRIDFNNNKKQYTGNDIL